MSPDNFIISFLCYTKKIYDFIICVTYRRRMRPRRRWRDDLEVYAGHTWHEIAKDREVWQEKEEAFAQQWDTRLVKKMYNLREVISGYYLTCVVLPISHGRL